MSSFREQTLELAALLQLHLIQEYPAGCRLPTSFETCEFFRKQARALQNQKLMAAPPKIEASSLKPVDLPPAPAKKLPLKEEPFPKPALESKKPIIAPVPAKPPEKMPYHDIAQELKKRHPHIKILDRAPDDKEGKRVRNSWKEGIDAPEVIIVGNEASSSKEQTFLHNLAHALNRQGIETKVINDDDVSNFGGWKTLSEHDKVRCFVGQCPIDNPKAQVPMEPIATYLKEPLRKSDLWNALLKKMASR